VFYDKNYDKLFSIFVLIGIVRGPVFPSFILTSAY
jgi:hypothetical protein